MSSSHGALRRTRRKTPALLVLAGLAEIALAGAAVTAQRPSHPLQHCLIWLSAAGLLYLIAATLVLRRGSEKPLRLRWIILAAVVFRLTLLPFSLSPSPQMQQSLTREHWEGEILHDSFNPYQFAPVNGVFAPIATPTIKALPEAAIAGFHPPLAEALFHWSFDWSRGLRSQKILFTVFDLLLMFVLAGALKQFGRPREWLILYAWSPLAVWEIAGNGHFEAVAGLLILLALLWAKKHPNWAGLAAGSAAMTQWYTFALAPAILTGAGRRWWRTLSFGVVWSAVVWIPYAFAAKHLVLGQVAHNVQAHLARPAFNASLYAILAAWFGSRAAAVVAAFVVAAVMVVTLVRRVEPPRAALLALSALLLLSPWVHPWMVLWLLPLVALFPDPGWLFFSVAVLWAYGLAAHPALVWLEYVPLYGLMAWQSRRPRARASEALSNATS